MQWVETIVKTVTGVLTWPVLILVVLLVFKREIVDFARIIMARLIHGGGLKIGAFELDSIRVTKLAAGAGVQLQGIKTDEIGVDQTESERVSLYEQNRGIMLVHALQRSNEPDQLYDIVVYVIPHTKAFIDSVISVSYFFGRKFGGKKFVSEDKARNFAIAVSAFGPMMCLAEITFSDGHKSRQYRYIDFVMGGSTIDHPRMTNK